MLEIFLIHLQQTRLTTSFHSIAQIFRTYTVLSTRRFNFSTFILKLRNYDRGVLYTVTFFVQYTVSTFRKENHFLNTLSRSFSPLATIRYLALRMKFSSTLNPGLTVTLRRKQSTSISIKNGARKRKGEAIR